jgi:hypothetical protein
MNDTRTDAFHLPADLVAQLRTEYDIADKVMRDVQAFVRAAGIPAINELRYAGYHLLNCVIHPTEATIDSHKELQRAVNHAKRATYEASEAGILTAFDKIEQFKDQYKHIVVSEVVSDWHEILTKCDDYRDRITLARQAGEDRAIDHLSFKTAFADLVLACRRLDNARSDLNQLIERKQTDKRRFMQNMMLSALAIVISILLAVFVAK